MVNLIRKYAKVFVVFYLLIGLLFFLQIYYAESSNIDENVSNLIFYINFSLLIVLSLLSSIIIWILANNVKTIRTCKILLKIISSVNFISTLFVIICILAPVDPVIMFQKSIWSDIFTITFVICPLLFIPMNYLIWSGSNKLTNQ